MTETDNVTTDIACEEKKINHSRSSVSHMIQIIIIYQFICQLVFARFLSPLFDESSEKKNARNFLSNFKYRFFFAELSTLKIELNASTRDRNAKPLITNGKSAPKIKKKKQISKFINKKLSPIFYFFFFRSFFSSVILPIQILYNHLVCSALMWRGALLFTRHAVLNEYTRLSKSRSRESCREKFKFKSIQVR